MSGKIRFLRFCVQCEDPLPLRCLRCVKHPNRKPRIVEVYGAPEIIEIAPCKCVRFKCQRPGCIKTRWSAPHNARKPTNHFCSTECRDIITGAAKRNRVDIPCSCGCGRVCMRRPSQMKLVTHTYFSPKCHMLHRIKLKSQARRAILRHDVQALSCDSPRCRGEVRDHTRTVTGLMACTYCGKRRDDAVESRV